MAPITRSQSSTGRVQPQGPLQTHTRLRTKCITRSYAKAHAVALYPLLEAPTRRRRGHRQPRRALTRPETQLATCGNRVPPATLMTLPVELRHMIQEHALLPFGALTYGQATTTRRHDIHNFNDNFAATNESADFIRVSDDHL